MEAKQTLSPREAALRAARARWGPTRRVRLDDLLDDEREVVLGLVRNAQRRKAASAAASDEAA